MDPLKLGATLSCKYRIDRLSLEIDGVLVYEATDTENARTVCVKIIRREALADADAFARFQSGAHDPNVVDFGTTSGLPYYVTMEREDIPIYLDDEEDEITLELEPRAAL